MPEKTNLGEFFQTFNLGNVAGDYMQSILAKLAAFGDPRMNAILEGLNREIATSTQLQARGAAIQGARLGQDVSSALGAIGGGSTGTGAVAMGIGNSLAAGRASQAQLQGAQLRAQVGAEVRSQFLSQLLGLGAQGGLESALGQLQSFTGIRQAELGTKGKGLEQFGDLLSSLGIAFGSFLPGGSKGKKSGGFEDPLV